MVQRCAEALASTLDDLGGEDDALALGKEILRDIVGERGPEDRRPSGTAGRLGAALRDALARSVEAFVEVGTREAFALAQTALERATDAVEALEAISLDEAGDPRSAHGRGSAAILVRELDAHLLETGVLRNLCLLSRRPSDGITGGGAVDELDGRLASALLAGESIPFGGDGNPPYLTLHQRKLRALLHLVDGETSELEDDAEGRRRVQNRLTTTCRALVGRLAEGARPTRSAARSPPPWPARSTPWCATAPPIPPTSSSTPPCAPPARATSPSSPRRAWRPTPRASSAPTAASSTPSGASPAPTGARASPPWRA